MSEFSRETLLNIIETDHVQCGEASALARMALAAMDSKPVAEVLSNRPGNDTSIVDVALPVGTQLYRHAQPAPVVPDVMEPTIEAIKRILPTSNPDEYAACIGADMWNTCRSAMLQELKKSAGTEATCRSDENVQVLHTKSPAQSDCCPAQNHVSPEQNGDTPAQSQGWIPVSERMPPSRYEVLVGRWWGEKPRWCCKWATYIPGHPDAQSSGWLIPGASWTPTHWMPLPAAPQEVR
ncbi:DUF551 domain-containing protein [Klebsiella pneumoniae]|uniref:DUF551 domain-containing protein n=1 Tax=Klebsiella pneumoniae TaxID=573 RepID=UPI000E2B30AC|nr:DUF551 domain-containing protein [Klebsiella pneumoniae]SWX90485.1 Protein of uncharacterised function (DUF551) [Klebsiella pneumoniae]